MSARPRETDHPDTTLTVHNMATLLAAIGRSAEAEALYGRALAVFETALGAEHPHAGICREGLEAARAVDKAGESPCQNPRC